jgi:hypothetical protein
MQKFLWFALTGFMGGWLMHGALPVKTVLENAKVQVVETTYLPGVPREKGVRASDQVIVFLEDCAYERLDPVTGETTVRRRKSGEVIWHDKGEDAPQLTNVGSKPYRTITVELQEK